MAVPRAIKPLLTLRSLVSSDEGVYHCVVSVHSDMRPFRPNRGVNSNYSVPIATESGLTFDCGKDHSTVVLYSAVSNSATLRLSCEEKQEHAVRREEVAMLVRGASEQVQMWCLHAAQSGADTRRSQQGGSEEHECSAGAQSRESSTSGPWAVWKEIEQMLQTALLRCDVHDHGEMRLRRDNCCFSFFCVRYLYVYTSLFSGRAACLC